MTMMMSRTWLYEWHMRFKEEKEDMNDDPRSGDHPQAEHTQILSV